MKHGAAENQTAPGPAKQDKWERTIYVIGSQHGPYKIGVATRPQARLREIQTGNHAKLSIAFALTVPGGTAMEVERKVHETLHDYRLSGEWFAVSVEQPRAS